MGSPRNILLDFDGTVINSAPGVLNSIERTFQDLEIPPPPRSDLLWCIGPGIKAVIQRLFPDRPEAFREKAMGIFRVHYDTRGYLETELYPGILDVLGSLNSWGYRVFLTTMKAKSATLLIVEHFKLQRYFVAVHASDPGGPVILKHQLLEAVLKQEKLDPADTIVVGDTGHDLDAAYRNGLAAVAVSYGYVCAEELKGHGANLILNSPAELKEFFRPKTQDT